MNGAQLGGRSIKVGRPNGGAPVKNKGAMSNPMAILQQQQQIAANPMVAVLKAQASDGWMWLQRVWPCGSSQRESASACAEPISCPTRLHTHTHTHTHTQLMNKVAVISGVGVGAAVPNVAPATQTPEILR